MGKHTKQLAVDYHIPYEDLSGKRIGDVDVLHLVKPLVTEPTYLEETGWKCKCIYCGKERRIGGRPLHKNTYKDCECIVARKKDELPENQVHVGRGLNWLKENKPDEFIAYLKKRNQSRYK
jgi:hypothetical protein